jgi:hypothetical protein
MAFIVTGVYGAVLFALGMFFARRERKEKQEKEEQSSALAQRWNGPERRTGQDRRREVALSR